VSFIASALLIRAVRRPLNASAGAPADPAAAAVKRRLRREIAEGLNFLRRHKLVRLQTIIAILGCVSFGAFFGQLVPWADTALAVRPRDDIRLGLIFAAWGVGSVVASVVYSRLARALGEIRVTLAATPLAAVSGFALALASHWLLATVLLAAWAVPCVVLILNVITLRAKLTPDRLQSRVNTAGRMLSFGFGTPLGALLGGLVASAWSPRAAVAMGAGWLALAALVAWTSRLRAYRHDPQMLAPAID
jgi:predicted MFS family arabinose efflux permease